MISEVKKLERNVTIKTEDTSATAFACPDSTNTINIIPQLIAAGSHILLLYFVPMIPERILRKNAIMTVKYINARPLCPRIEK